MTRPVVKAFAGTVLGVSVEALADRPDLRALDKDDGYVEITEVDADQWEAALACKDAFLLEDAARGVALAGGAVRVRPTALASPPTLNRYQYHADGRRPSTST